MHKSLCSTLNSDSIRSKQRSGMHNPDEQLDCVEDLIALLRPSQPMAEVGGAWIGIGNLMPTSWIDSSVWRYQWGDISLLVLAHSHYPFFSCDASSSFPFFALVFLLALDCLSFFASHSLICLPVHCSRTIIWGLKQVVWLDLCCFGSLLKGNRLS